MKRAMSMLVAVLVVAALSGCGQDRMYLQGGGGGLLRGSCRNCPNTCRPCQVATGGEAFNPGPPVGAVSYPYYTTRGPRDFLVDNPPSIGP